MGLSNETAEVVLRVLEIIEQFYEGTSASELVPYIHLTLPTILRGYISSVPSVWMKQYNIVY